MTIFETNCVDLTNKGSGVCKLDGRVVFVPRAVTGDRLRVRVTGDHGKYLSGEIEEILAPSEMRIAPECGVFGECGGCDFLHISREGELAAKREFVRAAFRSAGLREVEVNPVETAGDTLRYRNKAVVQVGSGMRYGYFREGTDELVTHGACLLYPEIFGEIFDFAAEFLRSRGLDGYSGASRENGSGGKQQKNAVGSKQHQNIERGTQHQNVVRGMYLRRGHVSGEVMLCVAVVREGSCPDELGAAVMERFPAVVGVLENVANTRSSQIFSDKYRLLAGRDCISDTLAGIEYRISPAAFFQINPPCAELIYSHVCDLVGDAGRITDLYSGIGTISLTLAKRLPGSVVTGVEIVRAAVEDARAAAAENGISGVRFLCADAAKNIAEHVRGADAVVLDPPRRGCERELLEAIADEGVEKVAYVSCNPSTLARDVTVLVRRGYVPGAVTPVDMFPRTGHVEGVCLMTKTK